MARPMGIAVLAELVEIKPQVVVAWEIDIGFHAIRPIDIAIGFSKLFLGRKKSAAAYFKSAESLEAQRIKNK